MAETAKTIVQVVFDRLSASYPSVDEAESNLECIADQLVDLSMDAIDKDVMRGVLTLRVTHRYQGFCPERLQGELRDPHCLACEATDRLLALVAQHG